MGCHFLPSSTTALRARAGALGAHRVPGQPGLHRPHREEPHRHPPHHNPNPYPNPNPNPNPNASPNLSRKPEPTLSPHPAQPSPCPGILRILDTQCKTPKASDRTFAAAVSKEHRKHAFFLEPRKAGLKQFKEDEAFVVRRLTR